MGKGAAAARAPQTAAPASASEVLAMLVPASRTGSPADRAALHRHLDALLDALEDPALIDHVDRLINSVPDASARGELAREVTRFRAALEAKTLPLNSLVVALNLFQTKLSETLRAAELRGEQHERDELAKQGRALLSDALTFWQLVDRASGIADEVRLETIPMRTHTGRRITLDMRMARLQMQRQYWFGSTYRATPKTLGELRTALRDHMVFVSTDDYVYPETRGAQEHWATAVYEDSGRTASVRLEKVLISRRELAAALVAAAPAP